MDLEPKDFLTKLGDHAVYSYLIERFKEFVGRFSFKSLRYARVFLQHRKVVFDKLYEEAFESRTDVLYVSIMSHDSLHEMEPHLEREARSETTMRVLTWSPKVGSTVVESFRKHLGEEIDACAQVKNAATRWKTLQAKFPCVVKDLRAYTSTPTMQGLVVKGQWAVVELLPYHRTKNSRPALYLERDSDPDLFQLFAGAFEDLYNSSTRM
jgi:hypothetical protein